MSDSSGAARPAPISLRGGERLRLFDLQEEDAERIAVLKELVYDRPADRAVFRWEYFEHPRARETRVFVVEHEGQIIASTTRLPATIRIRGIDHPAFFNIDSMSHPEHRRRGRMRELYQYARAAVGGSSVLFSKGSSPQIYPLLLSLGQREILPNTHLVSYPSAARWLMSRLRLRSPSQRAGAEVPAGFDDVRPIERFGPEHSAFFERISGAFTAIFHRDAAFMNWRYVDIPHRRYLSFQREIDGSIASVIVLSVRGEHGDIVDVLWDPEREDEPDRSIRLAQALFDEHGLVRVACFATHPRLRQALGRSGFLDRGETPRFSALVPSALEIAFSEGIELHSVDGDGDTEFS